MSLLTPTAAAPLRLLPAAAFVNRKKVPGTVILFVPVPDLSRPAFLRISPSMERKWEVSYGLSEKLL